VAGRVVDGERDEPRVAKYFGIELALLKRFTDDSGVDGLYVPSRWS